MKNKLIYSIFVMLLFTACKKKSLPIAEETRPEFYFSGDFNGESVKIEAGNMDYYMNSSWYRKDSNQLYVYKGDLSQTTFINGRSYALTILINDYKQTIAGAPMNADSALRIGQHLYDDKNLSGLTQTINFKALKQESSATYAWTINDGVNTPVIEGQSQSFSRLFEAGKTYSVTLNYSNGFGTCDATHTNVFKTGSPLQTTVTAIKDQSSSELKYNLRYNLPYPNGTYSCLWTFADNSTSTSPVVTKIFQSGTHGIKLRLVDNASRDTCISYYQLNAVSGTVSCDANYTAGFLPIQNNRLYSSVTVLLTDNNGVVYTSGDLVQPSSSYFEIESLDNYQRNASGELTKRLKIKLNCLLKNGTSQMTLTNGEAVIAVAFK